ncbi:hypothetical protein OIU78_023717 [Salix suchowensis]|nr:hypothetical protein OIU78_023717 [Salix suchowensis]
MIYFDNFDPILLFCFGSTTGSNPSPLLRPDLANLDDDGDCRKSAMKTLKSYVIGLDSKATPQFLAQVSSADFQGKNSNLTCSRTKQRKRENETRKTAHENPDLLERNVVSLNALILKLLRFKNFCLLICVNKEEEYLEGGGEGKARNKRECLVYRELKLAALIESPSNCGNNKEPKVSAEVIANYRSRTGRNLNPLLRQDLGNLDDDGDKCKSAMKTLKSYGIGLDSKATPQFLAQVSSTEFQGNISNLTCSR